MASFNLANNRALTQLSYDIAGNVLNDGSHGYVYDAENRIAQVSGGVIYIYDAEGRRVGKSDGTVYTVNTGGAVLDEVNGATWKRSEVMLGGHHLATVNAAGVVFVHADWLGTERARSSMAGAICQSATSQPFGDNAMTTGSCTVASPDFLTGKPRDTESGLDDFGARYLSSQWGRWMSADWTAGASAVPYATLTNPQSLNLYAYVGNDPVDGEDPDGHARYAPDDGDQSMYGDKCADFGGTDCSGPTDEGGPSGAAAEPASGSVPPDQQGDLLQPDEKSEKGEQDWGSYDAGSPAGSFGFGANPVLHHRGDKGTGYHSLCDGPCKVPSCNMNQMACQLNWREFLESMRPHKKNPNIVPGTECSKGCHPEPVHLTPLPRCADVAAGSTQLGRVSAVGGAYALAATIPGVTLPAAVFVGTASGIGGTISFGMDMQATFHIGCVE